MNETQTYICIQCKEECQSDGLRKPKSLKKTIPYIKYINIMTLNYFAQENVAYRIDNRIDKIKQRVAKIIN